MILQFPTREPTPEERRRTCFRCVHAVYPGGNTYCKKFDEAIDSELHAARDCEAYEEEGRSG